ncbi:MAG: ABC transporter ATP-binding protein [Microbacteriaceae bacterium]
MARQRAWFVLAAVCAVLSGACSLAPYIAVFATVTVLFDGDVIGDAGAAVIAIAIGCALAIIARAVLSGISTHIAHVAAYRALADIRLELVQRMHRQPVSRVRTLSSGQTKKLLHDDVEQLEEALAHGITDLSAAIAVPVTTTVLLFVVDWRLALVALLALVLLVIVSGIGMARAQGSNAASAAHLVVQNSVVMGYLNGIAVIRSFLGNAGDFDAARDAVLRGLELQQKSFRSPLRWVVAFMSVATGLAVVFLIPTTGLGFVAGEVDFRELTLFLLIALGYLSPVISIVGVAATALTRIQFSSIAISAALAEPQLVEPSSPTMPDAYDVQLENVRLSFGDRAVLDGVDLQVRDGEHIALVGATGAGKSSIAGIIVRHLQPDTGRVRIGGIEVGDIGSEGLAQLVAFVQQDEHVFAATLLENIRIARPDATDGEVRAAGEAAQLGDVVAILADGWDTMLGPGGSGLSGGQRQRISIARALLKEARIVILDEVSASLDTETERRTLEAIADLTRDRTVIAIAHRLDTIIGSDRIVVVEDGRILDQGTHPVLLERCERYAALWSAYETVGGWHLGGRPSGDAAVPESQVSSSSAAADELEISDPDDPLRKAVQEVIRPGVGALGFAAQWHALLGRGWSRLLRRGVPRLILEGAARGVPLVAIFVILIAAIEQLQGGSAVTPTLIWSVTAVLTFGLVTRFFLAEWTNREIWDIAAVAKTDLQLSVLDRVRRVPLGFFRRNDSGRLTTLVNNDIMMLDFQNVPQQIAGAVLQPLMSGIILAIIDWRLAIAAFIGIPLFLLITGVTDRVYHRVFARMHTVRAEATTVLVEQAAGTVQLRESKESPIARRLPDAVESLREASVKMSVRAAPLTALGSIAVEIGLVALILLGAGLLANGTIGPVELLLFLLLSLTMYQPLQELTALTGYRRNQEQIAKKIDDVWSAAPLSEPDSPATPADAGVRFEHVSFAYPSTGDDSENRNAGGGVTNVSFEAEAGQLTAIIGASGAGKSTLAHLTGRLWDADSGSIRIGGYTLPELGTAAVTRLVTTVFQDVYLFPDTIRANVEIGRPGASDDEIWRALEHAQINDTIRNMPSGLDTVLAEGGTDLSGGQRQRLSIARALLKDSPMLILDEAVAAVDPETEARVQQAIAELMRGRTVIVIAHRLSTLRHADRIVVFDRGQVDAVGTHEELMTTSITYRGLLGETATTPDMPGSEPIATGGTLE